MQAQNKIASQGKGILAADESIQTIGKRFDAVNLENTEGNRIRYRKMLFTTPGLSQYISGVIVFDETLRSTCEGGEFVVQYTNLDRLQLQSAPISFLMLDSLDKLTCRSSIDATSSRSRNRDWHQS